MQAHYDARAAHERRVEVAGADGVERTQVRTSSRQLETLFGTVEVKRQLYQQPGSEGLAPLDAALGLPAEKHSMASALARTDPPLLVKSEPGRPRRSSS